MREKEMHSQVIRLSGAYNIRDLGGYRTNSGARTRFRRIFRADSPHRLTSPDIETLLKTGLRTVIDLRATHELDASPNQLADLDELEYVHLPLYDALSPDHVHADSDDPDPLPAFYARTLDSRRARIAEILKAISVAPPGVVMFHCTAGKDRTGLISALLLGNANVRREDVVADYTRTEPLISGLVEEFMELARSSGQDLSAYRRILRARAETMNTVLDEIAVNYSSIQSYLSEIGVGDNVLKILADRLLAPDAGHFDPS
jgi:protein-tyrosine phosphatase